MSNTENPRAVVGDNQAPNYAETVSKQLAADYGALADAVTALLEKARTDIPAEVKSDEELKLVTKSVVDMRDAVGRALAFHKKEKEPYLRGGEAVDSFFFGFRDRLKKAIDIVGKRGDLYNQAKLEAERKERERVAREAQARADAERAEAQRKEQEAEEARLAAERARKPETIEKKEQVAGQLETVADRASVDAHLAEQRAEEARQATQESAADMTRQRFDTGHMATMKQVPFVEVEDYDKLPLEKLRPYLKREELLRAVKAWAKVTNHKEKMDGAVIEMRDATVYR